MDAINLAEKFAAFTDHWSPRVVGDINNFQVKLVKLQGEFVWHHHDVEDELFLVIKGRLRMRFRDRDVIVSPGEFIIVPHGSSIFPSPRRRRTSCCSNQRRRSTPATS